MESQRIRVTTLSKDEILERRALAMAKRPTGTVQQKVIEIVEFLLGKEVYAFEITNLREVVLLTGVTYIPKSPPFVLGVINLRGRIVPVIDLKAFIGVSSPTLPVFNKAIILQSEAVVVGFPADEVTGAKEVPTSSLQYSLPALGGLTATFFRAVTDQRVVILDAVRIMEDARLNQVGEVS
jgi:purine-binding chemotaxis protein CheW